MTAPSAALPGSPTLNGVISSRIQVATLTGLYMLTVAFSYQYLLAPDFSYLGYSYEPIALDLRITCFALGILPLAWMPLRLDRPSKFLYWMIYLLVIAPSAVVSPVVLASGAGWWVGHYSLIIFGFGIIGLGHRADLARVPRLDVPLSWPSFWLFVKLLSLASYGLVLLQYGFSLRLGLALDLLSSEITEVRLASRETSSSASFGLGAYALAWQSGVINPLLIALGILRKQRVKLVAGLFGQIVLFSVAANKSMLLSAVLIFLCIYLLREDRADLAPRRLVQGLLGLAALATTVQLATGNIGLSSILVRRGMTTPAVLTRYYIEFFSDNPPTFLGQSVLSPVVSYPYDLSVPRVVGAEYISETTNANANIFADAFANFGPTGILLFSTLLALVFLFIDSNSRDLDVRVTTALLVVPGSTLANSALLTTLLTHGILLALLLLLGLAGASKMESEAELETAQAGTDSKKSARVLAATNSSASTIWDTDPGKGRAK